MTQSSTATEQEPLLSTKDVAKALGRSRRLVGYLTRDGRLPEPCLVGRSHVWPTSEITPDVLEAAKLRLPRNERAAVLAAKEAGVIAETVV